MYSTAASVHPVFELNPIVTRTNDSWTPDLSLLSSHRLFDRMGNKRHLEEFLPILSALLLNPQNLLEAERLFETLSIRFSRELPLKITSSIGNLFIRCYLATEKKTFSLQKAHDWYQRMCRFELDGKPDIETFCLLLNEHCEQNEIELLKRYVSDFVYIHSKRLCFSIEDLLIGGFLNNPSLVRRIAEDILRRDGSNSVEKDYKSCWIDKFLQKAKSGNNNLEGESGIFSPPKYAPLSIQEQLSKSNGLNYLKKALSVLNLSKETELNEKKSTEKLQKDSIETPSQTSPSTDSSILKNSYLNHKTIDPYRLQELLENDSLNATLERLNSERDELVKLSKSFDLHNIRHLLSNWTFQLSKLIENKLDEFLLATTEKRIKFTTISLLQKLSTDKIALIVMLELFRSRSGDDDSAGMTRFVTLASAIGSSIEREILATVVPDFVGGKMKHYRQLLLRALPKKSLFEETSREGLSEFARATQTIYQTHLPDWTPVNRIIVGSFCLELAITNLSFPYMNEVVPLLKHEIITKDSNRLGIVRINPHILELISKDASIIHADPSSLPMLVPPQPWLTFNSGGYLLHRNTCVRLKGDPTQLAMLKMSDSKGSLRKVLLGLDILGAVPWTINEEILHVMVTAWNEEIEIAALPPRCYEEDESNKPLLAFKQTNSKSRWYKKQADAKVEIDKNEYQSIHSQRCDLNYKLEIAKSYLGTCFYFPHNIDFRGRAYPIPPQFNHIGSDICRGLLKFSTRKPLGQQGLRWLKIHLANLYGNNKITLDERVKFCDSNMENIRASATSPLSNNHQNRWWAKADDPWQCLACCKELIAAIDSGNPSEFMSNLPVHQDGSCNGPQHYAALGRDVLGAYQVNLSPSNTPQDIYGTVALLVEEELERDLHSECSDVREIASMLRGKMTRKIVKQPVMTNVYGVTCYGARKQIRERLEEFCIVTPEAVVEASAYISKKVFHSLDKLFATARLLQNWLAFCAKEISLSVPPELLKVMEEKFHRKANNITTQPGSENEHDIAIDSVPYPMTLVGWTNPVGFPAIQPYRKKSIHQLKTTLQTVSIWLPNETIACDVHKQLTGFPPNFIHSLDASHMFMTAIESYKAGLTFASVHDSFWTHASDIPQLNKILRNEFVKLHKENVMEKLREEFLEKYGKNCIPVLKDGKFVNWRTISIPPLPERGNFDIELVRESVYFFS